MNGVSSIEINDHHYPLVILVFLTARVLEYLFYAAFRTST